ncbi:MAG TPA: hypothetical protein VGZ23_20775 [bacterium]|nr:hypothetical protein [bacterium]
MISSTWVRRAVIVLLVPTLAGLGFLSQPGVAGASAANKMVVNGSFTEKICDATVAGTDCLKGDTNAITDGIDILDGMIKTSSTVALEITASVECSLATNVALAISGTSNSSGATAGVVLWVTITDSTGKTIIVPVDPNAGSAGPGVPPGANGSVSANFPEQFNGMVTFCNRSIVLKSSAFTTTGTLTLLENTTNAFAFTWVSKPLNQVGGISCTGGCKVTLNAAIGGSVTTTGNEAMAAITNRTLVVEPVNSGNTITF